LVAWGALLRLMFVGGAASCATAERVGRPRFQGFDDGQTYRNRPVCLLDLTGWCRGRSLFIKSF